MLVWFSHAFARNLVFDGVLSPRMAKYPTLSLCPAADPKCVSGWDASAAAKRVDLFGARELPNILHYLQRAALVHDENLETAEKGLRLPT